MAQDKKDSRSSFLSARRRKGERKRERETRERRRKSPRTSGARGENKGKARKMCLTWQRQFFSRSCRLNACRREAIGSREELAGKMAAISLQPPVEVFPLLPFILSLPLSLSFLFTIIPRPTKGSPFEEYRERSPTKKTLILINCLIFPRDVRDALPPARLVYISLNHREDAARSLSWI